VAVLAGERGQLIDESMRRRTQDADDYYLSKILSDREIDDFLEAHPDMWACMVLPGWMVGPGDAGPTSSGQVNLDFLNRRLPGVPPATFSVVDARDVAEAMWLAAIHGRRGERYIAAGRHMKMGELFQELERLSGVRAQRWVVPTQLLYAIGAANEVWARVSERPALISLATVRLMARERDRTRFDHRKSEQALGTRFRPVEETLRDHYVVSRKRVVEKCDEERRGVAPGRRIDMTAAATKSAGRIALIELGFRTEAGCSSFGWMSAWTRHRG